METTKEKRNKAILKMHNEGASIATIANKFSLSKPGVHQILKSLLPKVEDQSTPAQTNETIKPAPGTDKGQKVLNFGEYLRTGANEYTHKSTGEIIKVKFIPATDKTKCGFFVKA